MLTLRSFSGRVITLHDVDQHAAGETISQHRTDLEQQLLLVGQRVEGHDQVALL